MRKTLLVGNGYRLLRVLWRPIVGGLVQFLQGAEKTMGLELDDKERKYWREIEWSVGFKLDYLSGEFDIDSLIREKSASYFAGLAVMCALDFLVLEMEDEGLKWIENAKQVLTLIDRPDFISGFGRHPDSPIDATLEYSKRLYELQFCNWVLSGKKDLPTLRRSVALREEFIRRTLAPLPENHQNYEELLTYFVEAEDFEKATYYYDLIDGPYRRPKKGRRIRDLGEVVYMLMVAERNREDLELQEIVKENFENHLKLYLPHQNLTKREAPYTDLQRVRQCYLRARYITGEQSPLKIIKGIKEF